MAKSLPLGIDWIYATTREIALLDELLPVDLILIESIWILLSDLENLDDFSYGKSLALGWQPGLHLDTTGRGSILHTRNWVGNVGEYIFFSRQELLTPDAILDPIYRENLSRIIELSIR